MKAKGYEWAVLIVDDSTLMVPEDPEHSPTIGEYNLSIWGEYMAAFHAVGLLAGGWSTEGGSIWKVPSSADLAIAEIEGPGDYDGVIMVLDGTGAGPMPKCPIGIVTNFSTITRERAKPLIQAGITCLPEAYQNENPNQTPDNMYNIARNLGWSDAQPVAGVYPVGGVQPPPYPQANTWPLADYTVEYVI